MLAQSKSAQDTEAGVIKQFNALLSDRLKEFVASHTGSKGWVVDTQKPFNQAISDPTKYGSKDATCYNSDGKSCLWYNDYHPGTVSIISASAKATSDLKYCKLDLYGLTLILKQAIHNLVAAAVADTWR